MDANYTLAAESPSVRLLKYLPLVWAGAVTAGLFGLLRGWGYDDPYITYRYAENLARGSGFVYNAGERVLSTTTPLYAAILALAKLAGADIPLASNLIASASLAIGGLAIWWLGQAWQTPVAGAVGLLLYPLSPMLSSTIGAETALYLCLVLLGLLAYTRERYAWAAALLAAAALARADGLLAAAACAGHFLIARRRPIPWRAIGLYAALLVPWLLFAWAYFGTPFPATLEAKRHQGLLPVSEQFLPGLLRLVRDSYWRAPSYRPHLVVAALGLCAGLARRSGWLLIICWSLLYAAAYTALGVTSYFWYYGPIALGFVALLGLGGEAIFNTARRVAALGWAAAAATLLVAMLLAPQLASLRYQVTHPDQRLAIYRAAGLWLRERTPPDASVGALEVGIIGYYAERRIVDFGGLIQPEVARQLTPATSYDEAAVWAADRYRPDYLVLRPGALPALERAWVAGHGCRTAQTLSDAAYDAQLVVYDCKE